jgi:hypothetical protein
VFLSNLAPSSSLTQQVKESELQADGALNTNDKAKRRKTKTQQQLLAVNKF